MGGSPFSGPIPKRSTERRRRNKDVIETTTVNLDELIAGDVEIPVPPMVDIVDKDTGEIVGEEHAWDPVAVQLYESMQRSGQAIFLEPSDWATIYMLCEQLSRCLEPQPIVLTDAEGESRIEWHRAPMPGATVTSILKGLAAVMATEGDRRKLRIELERRTATDAALGESGVVVSIVGSREEAFARARAARQAQ